MKHVLFFLAIAVVVVGGIATQGVAEEKEKEQRLRFWGDLRGRLEAFRFSEDETGDKKESRRRIRYRLRLNVTAILNAHATAEIQVGTGDTDNRSGEPAAWMQSMLHGNTTTETVGGNDGTIDSEDDQPIPPPEHGDEEGNASWDWTDPYHGSGAENAVMSRTP